MLARVQRENTEVAGRYVEQEVYNRTRQPEPRYRNLVAAWLRIYLLAAESDCSMAGAQARRISLLSHLSKFTRITKDTIFSDAQCHARYLVFRNGRVCLCPWTRAQGRDIMSYDPCPLKWHASHILQDQQRSLWARSFYCCSCSWSVQNLIGSNGRRPKIVR